MRARVAAAEPRPRSRPRRSSEPSSSASISAGAELVELLAGERHPGRLRDPAPVRVAAVERRLDQRRVGDRARDPLGLASPAAAPRPRPAPTRVAPSPSATISSASCSSTASSSPSGSGAPAAPVACSSTVSLVLIWPSTRDPLERAADRRAAARPPGRRPPRRSARSRASSRSRAASSRPPWPGPRRSRRPRCTVHAFGPRSVVMIASAKASPPAARERRGASSTPPTTSSIVSGTPITPVSATATVAGSSPERRGRGVAHRQRIA